MPSYNINSIISRRSYSVNEIAFLLGVDRRTCGRWIKYEGLVLIEENTKPLLVMGRDLIDFIKKKLGSEKNVSISYCYDILRFIKVFFDWLSKQSGYKSKIIQTDVDYLNLTRKEVSIATQPKKEIFISNNFNVFICKDKE